MNITGNCPYETPCGWCIELHDRCEHKTFERGLRIKCNPIDEVCDLNINDIIAVFQSQQFVCSACGKIVSPEVTVNQDGTLEMIGETGELRGGLGNKVLMDHLCSECMQKLSFI